MSISPNPMSHVETRASPLFSTRKPRRAPNGPQRVERVLQALGLAVVFTVILVLALNPLTACWHKAIQILIQWLSLDMRVTVQSLRVGTTLLGQRLGLDMASSPSDVSTLSLHAVMAIGIFGMSWGIPSMPLRCGLRILCSLHALGLATIWLQHGAFPYSLLEHTQILYDSALICLLLTPALLAAGFFLVERSWTNRLVAAALIMGFQIFALPIKLVLHSMLVALLSPAIIPLLFLAAGPVLDIMLLAALYSWVLTWPQLRKR